MVDDDVAVEPRLDHVLLLRVGARTVHGVTVQDQGPAALQPGRVDRRVPVVRVRPGRFVAVELVERGLAGGRARRCQACSAAADLRAVELRAGRHREARRPDRSVLRARQAVVGITDRGPVLDHHVTVGLDGCVVPARGEHGTVVAVNLRRSSGPAPERRAVVGGAAAGQQGSGRGLGFVETLVLLVTTALRLIEDQCIRRRQVDRRGGQRGLGRGCDGDESDRDADDVCEQLGDARRDHDLHARVLTGTLTGERDRVPGKCDGWRVQRHLVHEAARGVATEAGHVKPGRAERGARRRVTTVRIDRVEAVVGGEVMRRLHGRRAGAQRRAQVA